MRTGLSILLATLLALLLLLGLLLQLPAQAAHTLAMSEPSSIKRVSSPPTPWLSATAALTPVRGLAGDFWADGILGKPDFSEITPNQVTSTRLFNPGGVLVDRSVRPNRVYVYDGGNSRVLGLSHLGHVQSGPYQGQPCTSNSDYPASTCAIQEGLGADLVLGQPSFTRSACNGDGNFQTYPQRAPTSASTLCSMPVDQTSPLEGGGFANMALDLAGNLYVPDWSNHRVLRYNSPFTTDTLADAVWGQADFAGNTCNRDRGVGSPDNASLCLESPFNEGFVGGVAIDSGGNLWVADNQNDRVLRFPYSSTLGLPGPFADLVLGQPNFASSAHGAALNQMWAPAAVRVDVTGTVYVADSLNGRVLVFEPPLTSGMAATRLLGSGLRLPTGLEFDLGGGLWVSDRQNHQLLLFVNGTVQKVLLKDMPDYSGNCGGNFSGDGSSYYAMCDTAGSIGIDSDGNVLLASSDGDQDVWRFPAPLPAPQPGQAHSADARLFKPLDYGVHNYIGPAGFYSPRGLAFGEGQLIVADAWRILFWNHPLSITAGQPADGYVGIDSFYRRGDGSPYGRIVADDAQQLWVVRGENVMLYHLPLSTGAVPVLTLSSPLPLRGGGVFTWTTFLNMGGIAQSDHGTQIWLSDPATHRVFRISQPITNPTVDIVLGQLNGSGTACNQGRGQAFPSRDSLCAPSALAVDPFGNLWVADHALEASGNHRLLEFDADLFPQTPATALLAIPASRVLGRGGSFTEPSCQDALCGPFQPAFDTTGDMVVGVNAYLGYPHFPVVYRNPLADQQIDGYLNDFQSMALTAIFDDRHNLYVADGNRSRVLIYWNPFNVWDWKVLLPIVAK